MTDEEQASTETSEHSEEREKAREAEDAREQAKQKMKDLEEGDPPKDLKDWPDDEAKYETFGGPEGPHSYDEGPEQKLGPDSVRHHEDGSVSVEGEKVDDPDEYKSDPIPGGPTDPNAPDLGAEREKEKTEDE